MICEVIRGLTFAVRIAEKAEKCAKRSGFACDEMPCFKDRDDEEEGRGCDMAPCRRDRDEDDEDEDDEDDEDEDEDEGRVIDVKAETVEEEKKESVKIEPVKKSSPAKKSSRAKKPAPAKADLKTQDKKDDKEQQT